MDMDIVSFNKLVSYIANLAGKKKWRCYDTPNNHRHLLPLETAKDDISTLHLNDREA